MLSRAEGKAGLPTLLGIISLAVGALTLALAVARGGKRHIGGGDFHRSPSWHEEEPDAATAQRWRDNAHAVSANRDVQRYLASRGVDTSSVDYGFADTSVLGRLREGVERAGACEGCCGVVIGGRWWLGWGGLGQQEAREER